MLQVSVGGGVLLDGTARIELVDRGPDGMTTLRLTDAAGSFSPTAHTGSPLIAVAPGGWLMRLAEDDLVQLGDATILAVRRAPSSRATRLVIRAPRAVRILREELLEQHLEPLLRAA
ncbi:unannotated protein [freshwater metagenome]|uniref:Unannotated protein n=1 Tax=freshwater metagenome TaxID=449393 RepID=A0A6J7IN56_9ZZZZ